MKPTEQSRTGREAAERLEAPRRAKILYAASTQSHLERFHRPYIEALKRECEVQCMAKGDGVDHPIPFAKSVFSPSNLRAIRRIRRILKAEKFDAVILNTSLAAFLCRMAMIGMRNRPRVLNIVHGYLFPACPASLRDRLMLFCEQINRRRTDTIAVMNEEDREITKRHRLCKGDTHFINGMGCALSGPLPAPDATLRSQYAKQGELLLCFVGELSVRKNQSFLIQAVHRLREQGLPIRLMLIGEGSEREPLEALIQELALTDSVFLLGNREPVLPYLAITDVYVSASKCEGLPFNLMEAMLCGLPIVASSVKGQTDLLASDPQCLYPAGDMSAFCTAVTNACQGGLGVQARAYPQMEQYTPQAVLESNLQLMKGILP